VNRLAAVVVASALTCTAVVGSALPAFAQVDGSDVVPVGAAPDAGSLLDLGIRPAQAVLGIAATSSGAGYWMVAGDGGIFSFGDAPFFGSMGGQRLNRPMVGMAATATGNGYWMFAGDGGIFAYGDARFFGSTASVALQAPIVAMVPTPSNAGYLLFAADGGVFAFGDAAFQGSAYDQLGGQAPRGAFVAGVAMPPGTGNGYWLVTSQGQVLAFGQAQQLGDLTQRTLSNPVVGIAPSPSGRGYWLAQADGQVWAFGDAGTTLAVGARCQDQSVVGLAARPQGDGLWLATAPRPAPVVAGLAPLDQLERENDDLVADLRYWQACQSTGSASSIRWQNPTPNSRMTTPYGPRIHPIHRLPQFHRGIDLAGGDTAIKAAAAGTVVQANVRVGYGNVVVIDHGNRISSLYSHFSSVAVKAGDRVAAGQTLGRMGATGFATGPHLHFEIRVNGAPVDPTPLIPAIPMSGSATGALLDALLATS
jgi:murein DD-endopeptidase MepM/ murein hydrolase activator NlpD